MRSISDPGEAAHTADGVDRAEALAARTMAHMVDITGVAALDTTLTSLFLLVEVLASLEVYAGLAAAKAFGKMEHLTAAKVAELRGEMLPRTKTTMPRPVRRAAATLH
jgi:hypothetical protein